MQRETTVQTQQHDKGSDSEGLPPFIIPSEQGSSKEGTKACSREETLSSSSIFTQEFLDHTRGGCWLATRRIWTVGMWPYSCVEHVCLNLLSHEHQSVYLGYSYWALSVCVLEHFVYTEPAYVMSCFPVIQVLDTLCASIFMGLNFCGLQICSTFTDFIFADAGNNSTWLTT